MSSSAANTFASRSRAFVCGSSVDLFGAAVDRLRLAFQALAHPVAQLVGDREALARLRLGGVHEDQALGREEHAGAFDLGSLDGEAEEVFGDRFDSHG